MGNPRFPSFLGIMTLYFEGFKTFMFHVFFLGGGPRVGGGCQYFLMVTPKIGEDEPILTNIVSTGLRLPSRKFWFAGHQFSYK